MTRLDGWLQQATRRLSKDSATQVRAEIQEHYESARQTAMSGGATADEADRDAVATLGDARTANCQYRSVLLTAAEARVLREGNWEVRAVCSRTWVKWVLLAIPLAALFTAVGLFSTGSIAVARVLVVMGGGMAFLFGTPFLPVYTPSRARVFRVVKWVVVVAMVLLAFGHDALKYSWLLVSCLWPMFWVEWTRASIRRKLRVTEWPKQLYL